MSALSVFYFPILVWFVPVFFFFAPGLFFGLAVGICMARTVKMSRFDIISIIVTCIGAYVSYLLAAPLGWFHLVTLWPEWVPRNYFVFWLIGGVGSGFVFSLLILGWVIATWCYHFLEDHRKINLGASLLGAIAMPAVVLTETNAIWGVASFLFVYQAGFAAILGRYVARTVD